MSRAVQALSGLGAVTPALATRQRRLQRARVAELVALRRATRRQPAAPAVRRPGVVGRMGG